MAVRTVFAGWADSGNRHDIDRAPLLRPLEREFDVTIDQRKQGVILAHADVDAGMELGTALTHDDVARRDQLTAVALDAQPLCC